MKKNILLYTAMFFTTIFSFSQEPLLVTITGNCSIASGIYNFTNIVNGKNNYINYVTNEGETIGVQIGFDGTMWVLYIDDMEDAGFLNTNVSTDLVPPNTDWQVYECENGTMVIEEATNSIDSFVKNGKLILYPNPAINSFTFKSKKEHILLGSSVNVKIFDVLGNKIKNINIDSFNTPVNISDLKKGVYFVNILSKNIKLVVE